MQGSGEDDSVHETDRHCDDEALLGNSADSDYHSEYADATVPVANGKTRFTTIRIQPRLSLEDHIIALRRPQFGPGCEDGLGHAEPLGKGSSPLWLVFSRGDVTSDLCKALGAERGTKR